MAYIRSFILFCLSILIKVAYSESNCGTSLCLSTDVIKPGVPVELSWHKSDNPNGIQISLLYGDNYDKTDCHELQGQHVLRSWKLNHGEEEHSITINDVDFDIEGKTFVFLVEYLTSNFCMMAPEGPKGLGTSYVVFDESMPVKKPDTNKSNTNTNSGSDSKTNNNSSSSSSSNSSSDSNSNSSSSSNSNSGSSTSDKNNNSDTKSSNSDNTDDKNSNSSSNNKDNNNDSNDATNNDNTDANKSNDNSDAKSNETDSINGINNEAGNNNNNADGSNSKDSTTSTTDGGNDKTIDDDHGFFNTFNIILFVILGLVLLALACCLLAICGKRMKQKDKNSNVDSLKQNSTTRMLSPTLTDDAFAEDSVYSAVNINEAIPPPPQNPAENYVPNVSVESFNSTTSQSGLISRHEAKMIAERFRCELQNPLNNEVDDASSIKDKKEETV